MKFYPNSPQTPTNPLMESNFSRNSNEFGEWLAAKQHQKFKRDEIEPEPKEVEFTSDSEPRFDFGGILKEWIWVKTKITITILGDRGVGKAFLANALLSTTFLNETSPPASQRSFPDKEEVDDAIAHMQEDERDTNSGAISKPDFTVDDQFSKLVNWNSETEIVRNLQQYFTSSNFDNITYDRHSWVLPQGAFVGIFNPKVYILTFSRFATVKITFMKESELRNELWQLHSGTLPQDNLTHSRAKYRHVLQLSKNDTVPLEKISNPNQLPISQEFLSLCNQSVSYKGKGSDPNLDRIYIREKLLETIAMYGPAILKVELQLPCSILSGNTEFCIIDSNITEQPILAIQRDILKNTNFLILTLGSTGLTPHTCKILKSSGYLENFYLQHEDCKIGIVNVSEREEVNSTSNAQQMFSFKSNEQAAIIKLQIVNTLKQIIISAERFSVGNFQMVERAFHSVHMFFVKPLLYLSLNLNLSTKLFGETTLFEVRNKTNMPALMAAIQNLPLTKNFGSLQVMNQKVCELDSGIPRERNTENTELLSKVVDFFSKKRKPRQYEKLIDKFHKRFKNLSTKLKEIESMTESHVGTKLLETMAKMGYCSNVKQQQEAILEQYFEICQKQFTGLVQSALKSCHERSLKASDQAMDKVVQALESSWPENLPEKDKERLSQTGILCKSSLKKIITLRLGAFRDQVNVLRHLNLKTLAQHFVKYENPREMLENSAKFMMKIFFECLFYGYQQIELLETHADDTFKCLVHSPVMKPALVMNFLISSQLKPNQISKPEIPAQFLHVTPMETTMKGHQSRLSFLPKDFPEPVLFSEKFVTSLPLLEKSGQRFKHQLQSLSLEPTLVTCDENSQFRAISRLLYATENAHYVVRLLLMNEILINPDIYTKLIGNFREKDINEYVLAMSREYQPGDFLTLRACANYAQSNVLLLSPLISKPMLFRSKSVDPNGLVDCPTLFLALSEDRYYYPLVPTVVMVENSNGTLSTKTVAETVPVPTKSKSVAFPETSKKKSPKSFEKFISETESSADEQLKKTFSFLAISDDASASSASASENSPGPRKRTKSNSLKRSSGSEREGNNPFLSRHQKTHSFDKTFEKPFLVPEKKTQEENSKKVPFVKSLKNVCMEAIIRNIEMYTNLHQLPEELLHQILHILSDKNQLSEKILDLLLDPLMTSISFRDCKALSGVSVALLSKKCKALKSLSFKGCSNLTIQDALTVAQSETAKTLEKLNLAECSLVEDANLIGFAKNAPNLTDLDVSECIKLSDMSLKFVFQSCKNLETLKAKNVPSLSDKSLSSLNPKLTRKLNLIGCRVSSRFVEYLAANFLHLTELALPGSAISEIALKVLSANCSLLEKICLPGMPVMSRGLITNFLKSFSNIRSIDFSGSKFVVDDLFLGLSDIPLYDNPLLTLEKVKLGKMTCVQTSKVSQVFATFFKNVTEIDLNCWENLTDQDMSHMFDPEHMPCLTNLNLSQCIKLTDQTAAAIAMKYGPNLTVLNARNCVMVGQECLKSCGRFCPNLTEIQLGSAESVTDESVEILARGCRKLEKIVLEECKISDKSILAIASGCCGSLHSLSIAHCSLLSVQSVRYLAKHCNSVIKKLDVSFCSGILLDTFLSENFSANHWQFPNLETLRLKGFIGLKNHVIYHPHLSNLNVSWCKNVDNQFVTQCTTNLPKLERVWMSWCSHISTPTVQHWIQKAPQLKYLFLKGCSQIAFKTLIPLVGQIRQTHNRILVVEY